MTNLKDRIINKQMLAKITVYSVSTKLMKNGIITAHPDVDINGADLLAIMKVSDGAKFARIQCKGRTIKRKNRTCSISIKKQYVIGAFTCLLYLRYLQDNTDHWFCFFVHDIKSRKDLWKEDSKNYKLTLYGNTFQSKFDLFYFSNSRVDALKKIIENSDVDKEFYYVFGKGEITLPSFS